MRLFCGIKTHAGCHADDKRLLALLEDSSTWTVPGHIDDVSSSQLKRYMARAITSLRPFVNQYVGEPDVLRGLISFIAASGPHRALYFIRNFSTHAPNGHLKLDESTFKAVLRQCNIAKQTVTGGDFTHDPAEQRRILHNLWHGLSSRYHIKRVNRLSSVYGAMGQLQVVEERRWALTNLLPKVEGKEVWDFNALEELASFTKAIEVKSVQNLVDPKRRIEQIVKRYKRFTKKNWSHYTNLFKKGKKPWSIQHIEYVLYVPEKDSGMVDLLRKAIEEKRAEIIRKGLHLTESQLPLLITFTEIVPPAGVNLP